MKLRRMNRPLGPPPVGAFRVRASRIIVNVIHVEPAVFESIFVVLDLQLLLTSFSKIIQARLLPLVPTQLLVVSEFVNVWLVEHVYF